jgi:TrpR-related protein YerC/YecD
MKRRSVKPENSQTAAEEALVRALACLESGKEISAFLRDLCTPAELEALTDRWRVVPYLLDGMAYRDIHDKTAVSVTTIGRVARFLSSGNGGYLAAIKKLKRKGQWHDSAAQKSTEGGSKSRSRA